MTYAPNSKESSNPQYQQQPAKAIVQVFSDKGESTAANLSLQAMMVNSPQQQTLKSTAQLMMNSPVQQHLNITAQSFSNKPESIQQKEEEPLQGKFEPQSAQLEAAAEAPRPNNTGLPDNLKLGIENLSGISMDHVKVHYNSDKPAQLQAHAYAQGSEIHVASGQERHLPHEAWHVVQQAQGRVKPTQMKGGVEVNDEVGLEHEADQMAGAALTQGALQLNGELGVLSTTRVVQRVISEGDLQHVPVDEQARILAVMNTYNEDLVREHLEDILVIFSTIPDWKVYTAQNLRNLLNEILPLFTLNAGVSQNPWIHLLMDDFGLENPRILIDDAAEVDGYVGIAQTCSVMSVVWLRDSRAAGQYSIRAAESPESVARTIVANQSGDEQFNWAEGATGLSRVDSAPTVQQLKALGNGSQFVLYSAGHVSAGLVTANGFLYYDPETGTASAVDDGEMGLYVGNAARYLS